MQISEPSPSPDPLLMTMEEAAQRLGIGRTLVYEQVRRGLLPSVRLGRCRRIALIDLERFVESLRGGADQAAFRYRG